MVRGTSSTGYSSYIAFVAQLIPLQRSLLLLNLQKAHYHYGTQVQDRLGRLGWAEPAPPLEQLEGEADDAFDARIAAAEGEGDLQEVEDLLVGCGLWDAVLEKEDEADVEVAAWGPARADPNGEFQVVQIGCVPLSPSLDLTDSAICRGLPFMLQLPPGYLAPSNAPPPLLLYRSLKRSQAILLTLTTMLQLLITYQPTAPSIAYGRAVLRTAPRNDGGLHGVGRGFADVGGGGRARDEAAIVGAFGLGGGGGDAAPAVPPRGRRATLSIVINVEAIVSLIIPLFLLSLKLGFLLWIFGRHASSTKRAILVTMAVAWVAWEGYTMHRRRYTIPRERAERERRRALQPVGIPLAPRAAPPAPNAADNVAPPHPPAAPIPPLNAAAPPPTAPRVREPTSRLTPRYWLNWIAAIGLASEARELGLVPRSIAGRPIVNPPRRAPNPNDRSGASADSRRRALRTAVVGLVLFFGTLSPEIERKRKRALEKRERLLVQRKITRERKRAAAEAAARDAAAGVGGPLLDQTVLAGRGVVSDEALFEDGMGESDQVPIPEAEGVVGEGESDEEERREREGAEGAVDEVAGLF